MNHQSKTLSQLRIIGGRYRSRLITFADTMQVRPTPNRVRETLFNWLQMQVAGAICLDAFAGSGALAFEALSRGAKEVIAFEKDTQYAQAILENIEVLSINALTVLNQDFFAGIAKLNNKKFDIIFLDPPFNQGLVDRALHILKQMDMLAPQGLIYFEVEKENNLAEFPAGIEIIKNQVAGQVRYGLLKI